ncbi:CHAT domain-containing protein [Scytonema sp. NUACC26]|uniref:CHAT domain-containing protein n=1 Tax=Scytonema sp. NUACC26 TaxID=3140176 RepID=UPI0034DCB6D0
MLCEIPVRILFLAADPSDASRLRSQQEVRDIEDRLRIAKELGKYKLENHGSVRVEDITQAIHNVKPHIIHFSGHGIDTGELCFENESGNTQLVKPDALAALFKLFASQVYCIVLNACHSEIQAKAIAEHIPFVIGMNDEIGDKAAIAFAVGFYEALAANHSIEEAYNFGCVRIQLQGFPEHLKPVIYKKQSLISVPTSELKKTIANPFVPQAGRVEDARQSLLYGEEMFTLALTLAVLYRAREPATIAALQLPFFPKEPLLRPTTWQALTSLSRVIEDTQVVLRSASRAARSFALNRAQGEIKKVLDNAKTLPQAEQGLIVEIAETWKEALLSVAGEVGEISITKPIRNPHIIGDPVLGERFVGREDVMRQLEELWLMGQQLQSVVIYGHRRMGKTSILKNAANLVGSGVKVAYVNLLEVGDAPSGVGEVLIAMSDAVSQVMNLQPPPDGELLNLPLLTFRRYLQKVIETLDGTSLIIALDEFEKIEDLIAAGKIPVDFMEFLRGLVQMNSKVAFAFAGLHTLEEMTADYFQPFFASVIPIHVSFLKRAATRQILANPDEEFPLDYTLEALDKIYDLTNGQPFLVQLVGFQLVRRYNDQVFEQQRPRDPVFGLTDVEAVINEDFFKRGRYYFDGVWGQAARGAARQQAIIRAIAPHKEGLSLEILSHAIGIDGASLQPALQTLKRHDVIEEVEGRYRITVELFRRWVVQFSEQ